MVNMYFMWIVFRGFVEEYLIIRIIYIIDVLDIDYLL